MIYPFKSYFLSPLIFAIFLEIFHLLNWTSAKAVLSLLNNLEIPRVMQTSLKESFFFLSRRFMRTGGRTSQITFLQAGRTAQWPSLMRKASGTTCPATTTCPTSARKEQVNGKCPQWRSLLAVANAFSSPSTAQKSAENCRSLRAISISLFSTCCLLPRPDKHSHPYCHQKLWSQFFPMTSLFRQNIPWCPPELR